MASKLADTPKLKILAKTGTGIPISAQCSICIGRTAFYARGGSIERNTKELEEQFQAHVRETHG